MVSLKKYFYTHFVKWKYLQSMIVIPFSKNGKSYLHISQIDKNGEGTRRTFLIEHLVDENLEITDQTLAEERRVFMDIT